MEKEEVGEAPKVSEPTPAEPEAVDAPKEAAEAAEGTSAALPSAISFEGVEIACESIPIPSQQEDIVVDDDASSGLGLSEGETARSQLLAMEGLDPDSTEPYVPSYFRTGVGRLKAKFNEGGTITLGALVEKIRHQQGLPHSHPNKLTGMFNNEVARRLQTVLSAMKAMGSEPNEIGQTVVHFRTGELCSALDALIQKLEIQYREHCRDLSSPNIGGVGLSPPPPM